MKLERSVVLVLALASLGSLHFKGMMLLAQEVVANARAPRSAVLFEETFSSSLSPDDVHIARYSRAPSSTPAKPVCEVRTRDDEQVIELGAQGQPVKATGRIKDVEVTSTRLFAKGDTRRKK